MLVVEDNANLAFGLTRSLESEGYEVEAAEDGSRGFELARSTNPDLVVLDLMLPGMDGYTILKKLRAEGKDVPVLILTARGEEADKVFGFRLGADDYVTKPFSLSELLARVQAILRRAKGGDRRDGEAVEEFGDVSINTLARSVKRGESEVALTPKEFDLLLALVRRRGAVASRLELLKEVWGHQAEVMTRTVDIQGPITGDGAKLRGFEIAYQQFFDKLPEPWNGLGLQTNFTYVDNQGITNSNLSSVSGGGATQQDGLITFTDLPLEGYSKSSYNVVLMFEQPKYSARVAWNWRDDYLISQSDCCIKLPIWQNAYGQLDASVHYKPSSSWDIFLDAQNLLQAETVLKQQVNNAGLLLPRSWFTNDLRLQLGVRYRIQ